MRFHLLQKANASLILPLFPFLIFVGPFVCIFFNIPVCLLLSFWEMSALCTTSVKYINKPWCNRIIYFHIHRDNCVTTVKKKKPHATAVYYMDAVEVVSFSVHVKIFDMPDAVGVFFLAKNNCLFALIQRITVIALS